MATEDLTFRFNVTGNAVPQFQAVQKQVRAVDNQVKRTTATVRAHANQYDRTAVATNKWAKGALQQAGFQIGDYAVQVANGTSKMQAFGQQGAQLAGVFGPLGAVIGAGIAIVSAIAVAFEKSGKTAKSFSDQIQDTVQSIGLYNAASRKALQSSDDLAAKYGDAADQARALFRAQEGLRKLEAVDALKKSVIALRDEFGDFSDVSQESIQAASEAFDQYGQKIFNIGQVSDKEFRRANDAVEVYRSTVKGLEAALGATTPQAFDLAQELASLAQAEGPKEINLALERTRQKFTEIVGGIENATDSQKNLLKQLLESAVASLNLNANIDDGADEVRKTTTAAGNLVRQLSFASSQAAQLAANLARAPAGVQAMKNQTAIIQAEIDAVNAGYSEAAASSAAFRKQRELELGLADAAGERERAYISSLINRDVEAFEQREKAKNQLEEVKQVFNEVAETGGGAMDKIKSKTKQVAQELTPLQEKMKSVAETIESSMEGAFMSLVDGTSSAKDAFRNMASSIIKELYRIFVVKQITGFISNAIGNMFGPGMTTGTPLQVPSGSGASLLPPGYSGGGYTGNGARAGGLDGKGGFMAMMHPRETVVDHTKGQSMGGVVVNQTINVSTGVQQTVRTEIKSLMPQIAESAKSAVVDAKRRGGSYGRAFA